MIHYEEPQIEGQVCMCRGKVNWFDLPQLKKYAPLLLDKINNQVDSDPTLFIQMKEHLMGVLKKQGFVFFDTTLYRYKYHKGKLTEFGVQYRFIK